MAASDDLVSTVVEMFKATTTMSTLTSDTTDFDNDQVSMETMTTEMAAVATKPGPNYTIIRDAYFFGMAVVIPIGLLCNVFSIGVFAASPILRRSTTGHYLIALSLADFVFLVGEILRWVNSKPASYDFKEANFVNENPAMCKITYFLRYAAKLVSAWVTVAITLERFITITFPLKVAQISTPFRAKLAITVITIVGTGLGAYPFWTVGVKDYKGKPYCLITDLVAYEHWSMVVLRFGTLVVPSLIIIVFTALIIYNLTRANVRRRNQLEGQRSMSKAGVERQLTIMLLAVAISFVILRLPYTICFYLNHYKKDFWNPLGTWLSYRIFAAYKITDIFATTNYCVNFFLYCVCGSAFRRQICICIGCEKNVRKRQASMLRTRSSYMRCQSHR